MKKLFKQSALMVILLVTISCKKDNPATNEIVNTAPVANAGNDTTISNYPGLVSLNGTATDAENNVLGYYWKMIAGPSETKICCGAKPTVYASGLAKTGTYEFELTVNDKSYLSSKDTVKVTVVPSPDITYGNNEIIFKDNQWGYYSYETSITIQISNIPDYLPKNSTIKKVEIKWESSPDWESITPTSPTNPVNNSWYEYEKTLSIFTEGTHNIDEIVNVKIEF